MRKQVAHEQISHSLQSRSVTPQKYYRHFSPGEKKQLSPDLKREFPEEARFSAATVSNQDKRISARTFQISKVESKQYGTTVYNEHHLQMKGFEQIEFQNNILRQQLSERDDLIKSFKSGMIQNGEPHTDSLINNLNLKLMQKNVLIEKISKRLDEFQSKVQITKIHPLCVENMKMIKVWIEEHEKHPVVIRQRFIETSHAAERYYILNEKYTKQWEYKLEQSYKQVNILREKIVFFENQKQRMSSIVVEVEQKHKIEIERMNDIINQLKMQLSRNQNNNNDKRQVSMRYEEQIRALNLQINNYKTEITNNITQINQQKIEINSIRQQSNQNNFIFEENQKLKGEIQRSKDHFHALQEQNNKLSITINQLQNQMNILRNKKQTHQRPPSTNVGENWKQQYDLVVQENLRFKQQINYLSFQVTDLKKKTPSVPGSAKKEDLLLGNDDDGVLKFQREISSYKSRNKDLETKYEELEIKYEFLSNANRELQKWRGQYENSQFEISDLKREINSLNSKIRRLQEQEKYEIMEWKMKYEESVKKMKEHNSNFLIENGNFNSNQSSFQEKESEKYKNLYLDQQRVIQELESRLFQQEKQYERRASELEFQLRESMARDFSERFKIEEEKWAFEKNTEDKKWMETWMKEKQEEIQRQIGERSQIDVRLEIEQNLRNEIERNLKNEIEFNLRFEMEQVIRQEIRSQMIVQLKEELTEEVRYHITQQVRGQERRIISQEFSEREEELRREIENQIKQQIIIEVNENIRESLKEQIYITVKEEYQIKINESQQQLITAENHIQQLMLEIERLASIIIGLEEKYSELLKQQNQQKKIDESAQIMELEAKVKEQEEAILKGREFLEQAESYIESLLRELEKEKNTHQQLTKIQNAHENQNLQQIKRLELQSNQYYSQLIKAQNYIEELLKQIAQLQNSIISTSESQKFKTSESFEHYKLKWQEEKLVWELEKEGWIKEKQIFEQEKLGWEQWKLGWNHEKQLLETQLTESHSNLIKAEDYIERMMRESEEKILILEQTIKETSEKQNEDTELRYYIDQRFDMMVTILQEFIQLQENDTLVESQFLKEFMLRKSQAEERKKIKLHQGVSLLQGFEHLLLLRRSEMKKVNIENMNELKDYFSNLKQTDLRLKSEVGEEAIEKIKKLYHS